MRTPGFSRGEEAEKVFGQGDVFLDHQARDVHLIDLEEESLTVDGANAPAFDSTPGRDIRKVQGFGGMATGGMFDTVFTGRGRVVVCHGSPVLLQVDQPTFVDTRARGLLEHHVAGEHPQYGQGRCDHRPRRW